MLRLSRLRDLSLTFIAIALWIVMEVCAIYLFALNRRVTRELVQHTWREPTTVFGSGNREVARLYGADWRPTPLVSLDRLPRYVGDAFIAAEDVRFRHHIGVDPIGMIRALLTNVRAHGIAQGGSTIDQQVIKGRYLSLQRTWRRK